MTSGGERRRRVWIVAGEPSGDAQAARLAAALARLDSRLELRGVCGPRLRAAGVDAMADIAELSVMGVSEVVGALGRVRGVYRRIVAALDGPERPDLLILVDFPEFNLLVAKAAKRRGVKVLYYVSPQVWAWRLGRVRKIRQRVDAMVVLFPFEERFYEEHGVPARFFGHPLAEEVAPTRSPEETRTLYGLDSERPLVALLPGSRLSEVRRHLPLMLQAARGLGRGIELAIARAPGVDAELVASEIRRSGLRVAVAVDDTYNVLAAADVAAVASGTATVEAALLGCPFVAVYVMSALTYAIARRMVKTQYVAMPNIVLNAPVVPELIQRDASPDRVAKALAELLEEPRARDEMRRGLAQIRGALVRPGAAGRAAAFALELIA